MEQARKWAKAVKVDYIEDDQRYFDYVSEISGHDQKEKLQVPSQDLSDVERVSKGTNHSSDNVSRKISYLLFPESIRENIGERRGLSKTVANIVPSRCTSVEGSSNALELIADLGDFFEGKGGKSSDVDGVSKRDIINWSIDHVNETGNVEVITEAPEPQEDEGDEEKSNANIAEDLGKSRQTISEWLEPFNWDDDTPVHPENADKDCKVNLTKISALPIPTIRKTRQVLDGSTLGVAALEYIEEYNLSSSEVSNPYRSERRQICLSSTPTNR